LALIRQLARRGNTYAIRMMDAFNPDQPRDERGRWGEGASATTAEEHESARSAHISAAVKSRGGDVDNTSFKTQDHIDAAAAHGRAAAAIRAGDPYASSHSVMARSMSRQMLGSVLPSVSSIRTSVNRVQNRLRENAARGQMSVFQNTTVKGKLSELSGTKYMSEGVRFKTRVGEHTVVGIVADKKSPRSTAPSRWEVRRGTQVVSTHNNSNDASSAAYSLTEKK